MRCARCGRRKRDARALERAVLCSWCERFEAGRAFLRCVDCGTRTEHGNRQCDRCAYQADGGDTVYDCPRCGRATETPGGACLWCVSGPIM